MVMKKSLQKGFSLIELMIVVTLVGLILGLGVPTMRDVIADIRMTSTINQVLADLMSARSEAIKLKQSVTMCATNNPSNAIPACTGTNQWQRGWVVFVDANSNSVFNNGQDRVIRVGQPLFTGASLQGSTFSNTSRIRFNARGALSPLGSAGTLRLCDARDESADSDAREKAARAININVLGRTRMASDDDTPADDIVDDSTGANVTCP